MSIQQLLRDEIPEHSVLDHKAHRAKRDGVHIAVLGWSGVEVQQQAGYWGQYGTGVKASFWYGYRQGRQELLKLAEQVDTMRRLWTAK